MTARAAIGLARAYDAAEDGGGARLLVDRVWPRGITRQELRLDDWIREVAPSAGLRKWFGHDPARWAEFERRYRAELDANQAAVERCLAWCRKGRVTLVFGAKDREHNQAVALRGYLAGRLAAEQGERQ